MPRFAKNLRGLQARVAGDDARRLALAEGSYPESEDQTRQAGRSYNRGYYRSTEELTMLHVPSDELIPRFARKLRGQLDGVPPNGSQRP